MITKVFLDLDDVLNDFTLAALQYVGCPVTPTSFDAYDTRWGFDIILAANMLHRSKVFTIKTFWNSIPRHVWANCLPSKHFYKILNYSIDLVGRENVCIVTSPTIDPGCAAGKVEWIQRNMPADMNRQFFIGPRKWFLATPDSLLIDDSDDNVNLFRAHGGNAILWPQPWNTGHITDYENRLPLHCQEEFNKYIEKRPIT